jgi:hypothetical protein
MNSDKEIRELFARHGVDLARNDVWAVQGKPVIHHKALERLAAEIGIRWKAPQILRAERDEAVILVTGELEKDQTVVSEWSIGEAAVNVNYRVSGKQAAYVYAMAEKRAKDRVIIKLAGLHGAYSNEEADNFDQQPDAPAVAPEPAPAPAPAPASQPPLSREESATVRDTIILALEKCDSHAEIFAWREQNLATFARLTREDKLVVSKAKEIREGEIDNSPQQEAAE